MRPRPSPGGGARTPSGGGSALSAPGGRRPSTPGRARGRRRLEKNKNDKGSFRIHVIEKWLGGWKARTSTPFLRALWEANTMEHRHAMNSRLQPSKKTYCRYFGIQVIVQDNMSIKLFEGVIPSPQNTSSQNCALPQTVVADEPPPPPPPPSRLPRLLPPENPAAAAPPPPVATKTASNR